MDFFGNIGGLFDLYKCLATPGHQYKIAHSELCGLHGHIDCGALGLAMPWFLWQESRHTEYAR